MGPSRARGQPQRDAICTQPGVAFVLGECWIGPGGGEGGMARGLRGSCLGCCVPVAPGTVGYGAARTPPAVPSAAPIIPAGFGVFGMAPCLWYPHVPGICGALGMLHSWQCWRKAVLSRGSPCWEGLPQEGHCWCSLLRQDCFGCLGDAMRCLVWI